MDANLPTSTILGVLTLLEVYSFYDVPRLFSCRNRADQIFLAVWVDEREHGDTYLYAPLSQNRFAQIRSGGIDLATAFKESEDGFVFKVEHFFRSDESQNSVVEQVACADLSDDELPEPGERLALDTKTLPELDRPNLGRAAQQNRRDIIAFGFEFPGMTRSEAPIRSANPIIAYFQDMIDALGQSLSGKATTRGRIEQPILSQTELALVGTAGGSFVFQIVPTSGGDMFGESLVQRSMMKFMSLLELGDSADGLRETLIPLQARVASRYRIMLECMEKTNISIKIDLASHRTGQLRSVSIDRAKLSQILEIVANVESEVSEHRDIDAKLIAANLTTKTFSLEETRSGHKFSGKVVGDAQDQIKTAKLSAAYRANLIIVRETSSMTDDHKVKYRLADLRLISGGPVAPHEPGYGDTEE